MSYAVVKFEDNTYSEIPVSWLAPDHQSCRWPPSRNVTNYIVKNILPKEEWKQFQVSVECITSTLEAARKKAEDAEYTSADDDFLHLGRGKRKKKLPTIFNSNSEESSDDSLCPPQLKRKQLSRPVIKECEITQAEILNEAEPPEIVTTNSITESGELTDASTSTVTVSSGSFASSDVEQVLSAISGVTQVLNSIDNRLQVLERKEKVKKDENVIDTLHTILPIKSLDKLQEFDKELEKKGRLLEQFKTYISIIGGRDAKDNLQRVLKKTISNEVGMKCSWLGLRENFKFSSLNLTQVLKGHILSEYSIMKEIEFEKICSEWLRLSRLRFGREKK